jgi:hypothetical protein
MFGHHIESGWADLDRAKEQKREGLNGEELEENQCICGEFNCKEEYAHWTSGF